MFKKLFWIVIPVLLIILSLSVGVLFYFQKTNNQTKQAVTSVSSTPTPIPTPEPAKLDLTKYNVQILNGTGIQGDAAKAKTVLEKEGFTTINTRNASQLENNTLVVFSSRLPKSEVDGLKSLLKTAFPNATFQTATPSAGYDLILTTGKISQ